MTEEKESYRDHICDAVLNVVIGEDRPNLGANADVDLNAAIEGIARAIAVLASTGPRMVGDRDTAVKIMDSTSKWISDCMAFLTEEIRAGKLTKITEPPKLRIVK